MRLMEPTPGIALREAVSRLMDDRTHQAIPTMPVNITETADQLVIKAQVPGASKEHLEIHYEKDVLTLKAEIPPEQAPEGGNFLLKERFSGKVSRTFRLPYPVDAEQAQAEYRDGLLILTLPRLESARPRQIAIQ